jgi:hypothetical protein
LAACTSTTRLKCELHNSITEVVVSEAKRAGCEAKAEPNTAELLQIDYEQAKAMFPDKASKHAKDLADELTAAVRTIEITMGAEKQNAEERRDRLLKEAPRDGKALRMDFCIKKGGEMVVGDVSMTHTGTRTGRKCQLKALTKEVIEGVSTSEEFTPATPMVQRRVALKLSKYEVLMVRLRLVNRGDRRRREPVFHSFVMSHAGEMSPGVFATLEWLAVRVRKEAAEKGLYRPSGVAAEFRAEFKARLAVVLARGLGKLMTLGGEPVPRSGHGSRGW